jgi:hypothetical protein
MIDTLLKKKKNLKFKQLHERITKGKKKSGKYFKGYRQLYAGDVHVWTWSDDNEIEFFNKYNMYY